MTDYTIRSTHDSDRNWMKQLIVNHWGAEIVVAHGALYRPYELPGFAAIKHGQPIGLVTYQIKGHDCEIVTLDSLQSNQGIGTQLIETVKDIAIQSGCDRIWLITTNDNLDALRFYQKRGFVLVAIQRNAIEQSRRIKPQIPLIGDHDIPIRDEIELELCLTHRVE